MQYTTTGRRQWVEASTGAVFLLVLLVTVLAITVAAVGRYGWVVGGLAAWVLAPLAGGCAALVSFLWLLPLHALGPEEFQELRRRHHHQNLQEEPPPERQALSISVIMPVYNGENFLLRSLPPLAAMLQRQEIVELIVVDDGSTDRSAEIAAAHGAIVIPTGGRVGPGAGRNLASRQAKGDVLWFVDADVVVHSDGVSHIRAALMDPSVVAVFGSYDDGPPELNFGSQYKNLVHHYHHQRTTTGSASTFWSGCGAVMRQAFLDVAGFDPAKYNRPSIEDVELGYRLREAGGLINLDPQFLSTHLKRWSVIELVRTDIFRRAIPWARLMLEKDGLLDELNVSGSERLRAVLAGIVLLAIFVSPFATPVRVAVALLGLTAITTNWPLFRLFQKRRGVGFAILAMAFHQLYYVYSTAVFVICWGEVKWHRARARRRIALAP